MPHKPIESASGKSSRAVAISIAALLDRVCLHPLDNLITHQQKYNVPMKRAISNMWKSRGIRSFYYGMPALFAFSAPNKLLMYSSYMRIKEQCERKYSLVQSLLISGAYSGVAESIVANPLDFYRTRVSLQLPLPSMALRMLPIYYTAYSATIARCVLGNTITLAGTDLLLMHSPHPSPVSIFLAGMAAGSVAQVLATPADNIKTQMMTANHHYSRARFFQTAEVLYHEGRLFNNIAPRIARISLGSGLMISTIYTVVGK